MGITSGQLKVALGAAAVLGVMVFTLLVLYPCPSMAQAYGIVLASSLAAGCLVFALIGKFDMSVTARGVTSSGAAAVFVMVFAAYSDNAKAMTCMGSLVVRVCDQAACPGGGLSGARVSLLRPGVATATYETQIAGEVVIDLPPDVISRDAQLFAELGGWRATAPLSLKLQSGLTAQIPMMPWNPASAAPAPSELALPRVDVGEPHEPVRIDRDDVAGFLAEHGGDEATRGAAALVLLGSGDLAASQRVMEVQPFLQLDDGVAREGVPPTVAPLPPVIEPKTLRTSPIRRWLATAPIRDATPEAGEASAH